MPSFLIARSLRQDDDYQRVGNKGFPTWEAHAPKLMQATADYLCCTFVKFNPTLKKTQSIVYDKKNNTFFRVQKGAPQVIRDICDPNRQQLIADATKLDPTVERNQAKLSNQVSIPTGCCSCYEACARH